MRSANLIRELLNQLERSRDFIDEPIRDFSAPFCVPSCRFA